MKRTRIGMFGMALVAMLAIGAIASASALALPEIVNKEGKEPVKKGFTSTSGKSVLETKSGEKVTCKADTNTGKITGPRTASVTISFTGCEAFGVKCNTTGAKGGEIILAVESKLVYTNEKTKEVGQVLAIPGTLSVSCSAFQKLKVRGSTICPFTLTAKLSKTGTLACKQKKGVQEPTEYEEGGKKILAITETEGSGLKNFPFEQSGLEGTDTLTFEEEVEIIA